jgi:hypothetical protein
MGTELQLEKSKKLWCALHGESPDNENVVHILKRKWKGA